MAGAKKRLDLLVVERGLAESRAKARAIIMAGEIRVEGQPSDKPGTTVKVDAKIERIARKGHDFVSRGALKLLSALEGGGAFGEHGVAGQLAGRVCVDLGASTGGFTELLLRRGAARVYAVDVGYGQLHWSLRNRDEVIVLERQNARALTTAEIPEPVELVSADLSFISLTLILPAVVPLLAPGAWLILLVKPQFEAGREAVGKGGVVRDEADRLAAIEKVSRCCEELGLAVLGVAPSAVLGPKGNQEYLLLARAAEA